MNYSLHTNPRAVGKHEASRARLYSACRNEMRHEYLDALGGHLQEALTLLILQMSWDSWQNQQVDCSLMLVIAIAGMDLSWAKE